MIYNVTFDICAAVIAAFSLLLICTRKDMKKDSNRLLLAVIIAELIAAVFDIWSSVGNSYVMEYSYAYRDVLNYVFLFVHTSTACLFAWYMITLLGLKRRIGKPLLALFLLPEIVGVFLPLALNPVLHWVFYYDAQRIYSHGVMIYVLYGAGYLYMLLTLVLAARYRDMLLKRQRNAAILLLIFSIVPIFVQQFFMSHQLIELFFQSIGIFGFLTTVENLDEVYHPVTKVYNRAAFLRAGYTAFRNCSAFDVVMVKLSRSSCVGLEMTHAGCLNSFLGAVAEWLERLPGGADVYDCERGHFALMCFRDGKSDAGELTRKIYDRFCGKWIGYNMEVMFPVQLCTVRAPEEVCAIEHMLRIADLPYSGGIAGLPEIVSLGELEESVQSRPEQSRFAAEIWEMADDFIAGAGMLTPAERNILQFYVDGYEIAEIPELACVSINTVRKHNKSIYKKLGVGSREEMMLYIELLRRGNRLEELNSIKNE